ncbi:FtsX-like permease family protein [Tessaracoccus caeni]|uniref:FtsX-like permease family protein n=1 Tax=Tessaracoccus caeni TaxID=3031239 RepID=UPI0023D98B74|nr:ABC transporter permease [Tessaracoccus caeni]MDF1489014.1 hypothetical protein [Tessaracoccus caeni]
MELVRYAAAAARGGWRRTLGAMVAVFMAVTSFVLLTGTAETQRLEVTGTIEDNIRGAYDILVRPVGTATGLEKEKGQVRANFLTGAFGGITLDQVEQVKAIGGVDVAAPIAMLGSILYYLPFRIDISDAVPEGKERYLVRYRTSVQSRGGNVDLPAGNGFMYVTSQPFTSLSSGMASISEEVDGTTAFPCSGYGGASDVVEKMKSDEPFAVTCHSLVTPEDPATTHSIIAPVGTVQLPMWTSIPLQMAAIDPVEEAKLVGLDETVVAGRFLTADDSWTPSEATPENPFGIPPQAPALLVSSAEADYQVTATIDLLPDESTSAYLEINPMDRKAIETATMKQPVTVPLGERAALTSDLYDAFLAAHLPGKDHLETLDEAFGENTLRVDWLLQTGEVSFAPGLPLRPQPTVLSEDATKILEIAGPETSTDTALRPLTLVGGEEYLRSNGGGSGEMGCEDQSECWSLITLPVVGHFDPKQVEQGAALGRVPLQEYEVPQLNLVDDVAKEALDTDRLLPDLNPAGYAQSPPSVLISIASLPVMRASQLKAIEDDPISAIRVRVSDVTGVDEVSRERIRLVAQQIVDATGLEVDIVLGSSQVTQRVELPETKLGSPALAIDELWSQKGVAVKIAQALDLKSLALFGLILASSALTVAVVARASMAARRHELAVLMVSGWPARRITAMLLIEAVLIGLAAGIVGAVVSWPLAGVLGVAFDATRAAWAIPIAVGLTVLASLAAAFSAGRRPPIETLGPAVSSGRGAILPLTGPISLGLVGLLRRPGRLVAGAAAGGLGVGALVFLGAVTSAFQGAVVGSLMGDVVAIQVRAPDVVAAVMLAVLATISIGVILLLGITEDARGYAALAAAGWQTNTLVVAMCAQAVAIALVGAVLGVGIASVAMAVVLGTLPAHAWLWAGAVTLGAVAVSLLVAVATGSVLRRLDLARLLAGD